MPSQRKKGKKLLGAYVDGPVHQEFEKRAKAEKLNTADLLRKLVSQYLERHGKNEKS